jgi:hypothetical protein
MPRRLAGLDAQHLDDRRVGPVVGDQEDRVDLPPSLPAPLALAVQPADALVVHGRRPVELAEHRRRADVLQAVEPRAGAQADDEDLRLAGQEPLHRRFFSAGLSEPVYMTQPRSESSSSQAS